MPPSQVEAPAPAEVPLDSAPAEAPKDLERSLSERPGSKESLRRFACHVGVVAVGQGWAKHC